MDRRATRHCFLVRGVRVPGACRPWWTCLSSFAGVLRCFSVSSAGSKGLYGPDRCKSVVCPKNTACKLFPDFIPVCSCTTSGFFYDAKQGSCFSSEYTLHPLRCCNLDSERKIERAPFSPSRKVASEETKDRNSAVLGRCEREWDRNMHGMRGFLRPLCGCCAFMESQRSRR